ncbi:Cation/H(+) antiporter 15 [Rhynchospora pubera]|uniref:Cation/H(+) antiporter 15 n=1 Tax=Rhynchospora pubera TaxID=906938 RepID=A0AAV8FEI7_9POAL|nr:Cation/H(+) antiporter 15 [Rhynchospora pubera]
MGDSSYVEANATRGAFNPIYCANPDAMVMNGLWRKKTNLSEFALTTYLVQSIFFILLSRIFEFILSPLHQPPFVSDVLVGIIFGSGYVIKDQKFNEIFVSKLGTPLLKLLGNFGLMYVMFLAGVKLDTTLIRGIKGKFAITTAALFVLPICFTFLASFKLGLGKHLIPQETDIRHGLTAYSSTQPNPMTLNDTEGFIKEIKRIGKQQRACFLMFISLALSLTSFPMVLYKVTKLKMIGTEPGRLALSAAAISELVGWVALATLISWWQLHLVAPLYLTCWAILWIVFCLVAVRPAIRWLQCRTPSIEQLTNRYVGLVMVGVAAGGLVNEIVGMHAAFGTIVLGLAFPAGPLAAVLVDRSEEFLTNFMYRFYFITIGSTLDFGSTGGRIVRTNGSKNEGLALMIVILVAMACKLLCGLIVAVSFWMPAKDGLTLGILLLINGPLNYYVLKVAFAKKV